MASPPPTPDPEGNIRRLRTIGTPCEWPERYRPGGYHPVDLGDKLRDGAYTVIRKLGYGAFSTVWLAVDSPNNRYVALKITRAKESTANTEIELNQLLSKTAHADPRSEHVITLLDTFVEEGPNGKHKCLVLEPMGPSATLMADELPGNNPRLYGKINRFPKWMAKKMLIHTLRGLAFLHENNVVHGDVQPGNILFAVNDISNIEVDELKQDESIPETVTPVSRKDGKIDKWAPKKVYLEESLYNYVPLTSDLKVKIADLGCSFQPSNPPSKPGMPTSLRAPELIFGKPIGTPIDIWAFGCLVFEFLTGKTLFQGTSFGSDKRERDGADDYHLIQLNEIIEKLPDCMINAWPRASKWYDPVSGACLNPYPQYPARTPYPPLEVLFAKYKPDAVDDAESAVICSIIRHILRYLPEDRPTANDLLKHPWFLE